MVVMVVFTESSSGCGKAGLFHVEGEERAGGQDAKGRKGGINGEFKVVLEKLVAFHIDNDGRRVASSEETEVLQKMRESLVVRSGLRFQVYRHRIGGK